MALRRGLHLHVAETVKGYYKTSKKISRLSKKSHYYMRVRTYMKTGGSTYPCR
ncbi:MAG: hypothetical protein SOU12_02685 [Lentihominibacter sp.]|nr:hypothetical protein [Lentihominibacter sp.]